MQNSPAEIFRFIQLRPPRPAGEVESIALSRTDFARMLADIDGKDSTLRIVDPADPRRIFGWRICENARRQSPGAGSVNQ